MIEKPEILLASDLARMVNVGPDYIARLCRQGRIPAMKLGSTWIIRAEVAEEWLAKRAERLPKD